MVDERSREMLALLVKTHIATGEPVGSRTIAKLSSEGLSPATVRNIIADLEDAGYLEQPHTSSGRVPTDRGYRFYVDHVLEQTRLSQSDATTIEREMHRETWPSADRLMARASHLLSDLSEHVGIVVSPSPSHDVIKHIEFVRLSDGLVLVVTISQTGLVQDRMVRVDEDFSQEELDRTTRYVNSSFRGMSLADMRAELVRRMVEEKALYDRLLQNAILLCERGLSDGPSGVPGVFVEGTSNMITKRDFADTERMRELFRVFEEKSRLVKLLNECVVPLTQPPPVGVRIGAENNLPSLRGCAVVTSAYSVGDRVVGSLGVVGPVRMEYARMISVVNYVARVLEQMLAESYPRS
jgi:heat-inducible transcriptional repressor